MALKIENLTVCFGGQIVVDNFSLEVRPGEIVGLIGPNGSGKSTVMNAATGVLVPDAGRICVNGHPLTPGRPDLAARHGLGRTFQIPRLARRLSVFQNLLVAAGQQPGERIIQLFFRPSKVRQAERVLEAHAREILDRVGLGAKTNVLAGELSGGQQKLLTLGMLLMGDRRVMLLDEPAAGVNPVLVEEQIRLLSELRDEGHTILLIEHNMRMITRLCSTLCVLDSGKIIAYGDPAEVQRDPGVLASYLSIKG